MGMFVKFRSINPRAARILCSYCDRELGSVTAGESVNRRYSVFTPSGMHIGLTRTQATDIAEKLGVICQADDSNAELMAEAWAVNDAGPDDDDDCPDCDPIDGPCGGLVCATTGQPCLA